MLTAADLKAAYPEALEVSVGLLRRQARRRRNYLVFAEGRPVKFQSPDRALARVIPRDEALATRREQEALVLRWHAPLGPPQGATTCRRRTLLGHPALPGLQVGLP
jgi:hypothetical protein